MNVRYRLLMFDWDGTLVDSIGHIVDSMQGAITAVGRAPLPAERIRGIIGLGMREAIMELLGADLSADFIEDFKAAYRRYYFRPDAPQRLFPGARSLLATLAEAGCLLAVATGKSRRGLDLALREFDLAACFHASRCADETRSKPDPLMVQELLAQLQIRPEEAAVVGDTVHDMAMARRAGVTAIGITHGVDDSERLLRHGAQFCIDRLPDLVPRVARPAADSLTYSSTTR